MFAIRFSSRPVRVSLVVGLVAAAATVLGAGPASAAGNGVFIACGYSHSVPVATGSGCTSLDDALTAALNFAGQYASATTVELMPGNYCPLALPIDSRAMTIVGVGIAGLDTSGGPVSFDGPEAALSSFVWNSTSCGASPPADDLQTTSHGSQLEGNLTLENLAAVGVNGGPSDGIDIDSVSLDMRDVIAENFTGAGMTYTNSSEYDGYSMEIENSAFLDNSTGVDFIDEGSIDESTIVGNSGDGLRVVGDMHLDNDTISDNEHGIDIPNFGNSVQMANTIVGGNTVNDCAGTVGFGGDLEPGGVTGGNGNNLIGNTCGSGVPTDIALTDTIAGLASNGGPTPSIRPPGQAQGTAEPGYCGSTGSDQREYIPTTAGGGCDIGSVDTTNSTGTPAPETSSGTLGFGTVPKNQPAVESVSVGNAGGDLLGISGAKVTGSAFSITADACTYTVIVHTEGSSCYINVQAAPKTVGGNVSGTLKVQTTGGEIDVPLTATGGAPLTAPGSPTAVHGTAGEKKVNLIWTAPANDGGQTIEVYHVRYSTNGGSTWIDAQDAYDTTATVTHLKDGTAYVFDVAADNDFLTGAYSAKSTPLTPHGATDPSALKPLAPTTIKNGTSTTLTTTLTDAASHSAIGGATVSLMAGTSATGISATTDPHGVAAVKVHPKVNTHYKWVFGGTTGHHAVKTPSATVSVAQVVRAALSSSSVKHGKATKVFGTVAPNESGKVVTVERLVSGTWSTVGKPTRITLQTLPNHKKVVGFVFSYQPNKKGSEKLRVVRNATSTNAAGTSKRLTLKVT